MDRIQPGQLRAERAKMLQRLLDQEASDTSLRQRALSELNRRVEDWWGGADCALSKFLDFIPAKQPVMVSGDPTELLIVRAISTTTDPATFGITPDGAVFVTDNGRWDDSGRAVFVTGLSPMLDQVTNICSHLTDGTGGRFREHEGKFSLDPAVRDDVAVFAVVERPDDNPASQGFWDRLFSVVWGWWHDDKPDSADRTEASSGAEPQSYPADSYEDTPSTRKPIYELVVNFDTGAWPASGVLSEMGYRVGSVRGLPPTVRRQILREVLTVELIPTSPETEHYLREWGLPGSPARLWKMKRCLGGFIAGAERKTRADMSAAIADWASDLEWLKSTFGR